METIQSSVDLLKTSIERHSGMQILHELGFLLKKSKLSETKCKIFFASLWPFYQQTPSGIMSLALRVNDFWNKEVNPWTAMENAALLLSTSVDEFGLEKSNECFQPTHHQLFLQAAKYYKVTEDDIISDTYILPSSKQMGQLSYVYYREKPLAEALGFHFASELTSYPEFKLFFEGFYAHSEQYQLKSPRDTGLYFFWIHTLVEPVHLTSSIKMIDAYLKVKPQLINSVIEGAQCYMQSYATLFSSIKNALS